MSIWFEVPAYPANWLRDRTIVRCYDDEGHEIAVVDGATGLRWLVDQRDDGSTRLAVDTSVLPAGRWVFDGVYMTTDEGNAPVAHPVHTEGVNTGEGSDWDMVEDYWLSNPVSPWDYEGQAVFFSTYAERKARLDICHACEHYNHHHGTCALDGNFMPAKTINAHEECPIGKWAKPSWWSQEAADARLEAALPPRPITPEDQADFEAQWEALNAG